MKKIGDLADKNIVNTALKKEKKELATIDTDIIFKRLSEEVQDPHVEHYVEVEKRLENGLRESKTIIKRTRHSLLKDEEEKILNSLQDGWKLIHSYSVTQPIKIPVKEELIALKDALTIRSTLNKRKYDDSYKLIQDFVAVHNTYGKKIENIESAYHDNLWLYPMEYLKGVLNANYWQRTTLPTLSEIQEALRYHDGDKSRLFWAIISVQGDTIDYNDDMFNKEVNNDN